MKGVSYPVVKKENSERVIALIRAIVQKHRVILRGYHSANSNIISDRGVEPFQFTLNYGYIWCYETESRENKLFKTVRISQVIDTGKSWEAEPFHEALPTDIFRISGKGQVPVTIRVSLRAANLRWKNIPCQKSTSPKEKKAITSSTDGSAVLK
ncbi:MAG: hypothetical protein ISS17_10175, partial [Bacteroidales bacterium]|nr:hypothetical protein [Bacteroidales bacterium]